MYYAGFIREPHYCIEINTTVLTIHISKRSVKKTLKKQAIKSLKNT